MPDQEPCEHGLPVDTKCYDCSPLSVGASASWADYESAEEANHKVQQVNDLAYAFRAMTSNILFDMMASPAEKVKRLKALVDGFGERVMLNDSKAADSEPSFLAGIMSKAGLRKRATAAKEASPAPHEEPPQPGFRAFKDREGTWRWLAIHSNNLRDRDGEVFPLDVHKEYVDYVDGSGDLPELWLWHTPGSKCGKAEMVDVTTEGFVVSAGTFDSGREAVAERLAAMPGLGVSHGFRHTGTDGDKAYAHYRTFEISPLPASAAANEFTAFEAEEELKMFNPAKKAYLASLLGPAEADELERRISAAATKAAEQGIAFKDVLDAIEPEPTPAAAAATPVTPAVTELEAALTKALGPLAAGLAQLQATVGEHSKALETIGTKAALPSNAPFIASAASATAVPADDSAVAARAAAAQKDTDPSPEWVRDYRDVISRALTGAGAGQ